MIKLKALAPAIGLAALLALAVGCSNGEASKASGVSPNVAAPPISAAPLVAPGGLSSFSESPLPQASGSQAGIWVTGEGKVTLVPDLALLNIGIEATGKTVAEAREEAARAMNAVVAALRAQKIAEKDIQTQHFNISPRYEYREVLEGGTRVGKQVLVGYTVTNSAAVKVRNLEAVGAAIDEVASAGGNATRINGISLTVEDPTPYATKLREAAVADALAKARHFASLTGVSLGKLVFISETGGGIPVARDFLQKGFALEAAAAPITPISGGELELRLGVQAVFDIQP